MENRQLQLQQCLGEVLDRLHRGEISEHKSLTEGWLTITVYSIIHSSQDEITARQFDGGDAVKTKKKTIGLRV